MYGSLVVPYCYPDNVSAKLTYFMDKVNVFICLGTGSRVTLWPCSVSGWPDLTGSPHYIKIHNKPHNNLRGCCPILQSGTNHSIQRTAPPYSIYTIFRRGKLSIILQDSRIYAWTLVPNGDEESQQPIQKRKWKKNSLDQ